MLFKREVKRSSRSQMLFKIGVFKNFTNVREKKLSGVSF